MLQIGDLKNSYIKFKSFAYFDSFGSINRGKVAEFESQLEENLKALLDNINGANRAEYLKELVNGIGVFCYPKQLHNETNIDGVKAIELTNLPEEKHNIARMHYFINLPVEAHILSVMWIFYYGHYLDKCMHKHCYGNRLYDHINFDTIDSTPYLFQPYYKKYESWRDEALDSVNKMLDSKNDAVMVTLDLKNYYYCSAVNFIEMNNDIKKAAKEDYKSEFEWLNSFIEDLFTAYDSLFDFEIDKDRSMPMIPIGFLPSLIIANWNLLRFDECVIEELLPVYYGRYVDDIIVVLPFQVKSEKSNGQPIAIMDAEKIIRKYFTINSTDYPKNRIFKFENNISLACGRTDEEDVYPPYKEIYIQMDKVKLYKFSHRNTRAMISNFKEQIKKNTSEFNLMHEKEDLLKTLENKIYVTEYTDSVNKLRSVADFKIDKFNLSKALSWLLMSSLSDDDFEARDNYQRVIEIFKGSSAIELMILWEKVIAYLFVQKKYKQILELIDEIVSQINKLTFGTTKDQTVKLKSKNEIIEVRNTLINTISNVVYRIFCLRNDEKVNGYKEKIIALIGNMNATLFSQYIQTRLINNRMCQYPLANYDKALVENIENGYDLINGDNQRITINENCSYVYYPHFIHLHECILHQIEQDLNSEESCIKSLFKTNSYIDSGFDLYKTLNNLNAEVREKYYVDKCVFEETNCRLSHGQEPNYNINKLIVGHKNIKKLHIGIVNTKVSKDNVLENLKGKPNRKSSRLDALSKVINDAIRKKIELLVMPEFYIPFSWIRNIAEISRRHQIAMVFGVEHVVRKGIAYNYIVSILPSTIDGKYSHSIVSIRLKNHYAPSEIELVRGNHLEIPKYPQERNKTYNLLSWNNVFFAPYYCFEIADIHDRSLFKDCCDLVIVSEFNKDVIYFNNIVESIVRDLHCYCVQVNTSQFGDNCVAQPTSSETRYITKLKGGENDYVVIAEVDIESLRNSKITEFSSGSQMNYKSLTGDQFKPQPPCVNYKCVRRRMGLL